MHDTPGQSFEKDNYMESGRPAEGGQLAPGRVVSAACAGGEARFTCDNGAGLTVTALAPKVVRLRYCSDAGYGDGFSYAVADGAGAGDRRAELEMEEGEEGFRLSTGELVFDIARDGLRMRVEDAAGELVSEDDRGFHWQENKDFGGDLVFYSRRVQPNEHFYGLGDKSCHPELRGKRFTMWGSDTYGYGVDTDPLYKNIPFFIGLGHGRAYGVFFDNSFRSFFDFGNERPKVASFWAHGGEMDFYLFGGPTVREVVRGFSALTGTAGLPPLWALGYHQCKWSYKTEAEARRIARTFRELDIPCDAIYLDIDYMDGFRCFTWDRDAFPDPGGLTRELAANGFKTVAMIDPGIKIDPGYAVYDEGVERGVFCKRMDGTLFRGNVWPGACHFPDFTDPRVREWWGGLYRGLLEDDGVAGVWNDMNEPAVFNDDRTFPRDVRHDYDGHPCSHRRAHNVYGMQMVRATEEGLRRHLGGRRPFVITRSAYAGAWRHSSTWTGDNVSSWEHLRIANIQCQRLALSGYSFVGSDIGGFLEKPEGELFTRWVQMGIFHPLCRTHSSGDQGDQEPWSFGEPYTSAVRDAIKLRYRLLPYLYTAFRQHVEAGAPVLRPLVYLDCGDPEMLHRDEEFGVGDHLLTCPVSKPGLDGRWVYLPGGDWYDFWTGCRVAGGDEVWAEAPLERTPLFVRAGAVLPLGPALPHSGARDWSEIELHIYAPPGGGEVESSLYEDAGEGQGYRAGEFRVRRFTVSSGGGALIVGQEVEGDFAGVERFRVVVHGLAGAAGGVTVDGETAAVVWEGRALVVDSVPAGFRRIEFCELPGGGGSER